MSRNFVNKELFVGELYSELERRLVQAFTDEGYIRLETHSLGYSPAGKASEDTEMLLKDGNYTILPPLDLIYKEYLTKQFLPKVKNKGIAASAVAHVKTFIYRTAIELLGKVRQSAQICDRKLLQADVVGMVPYVSFMEQLGIANSVFDYGPNSNITAIYTQAGLLEAILKKLYEGSKMTYHQRQEHEQAIYDLSDTVHNRKPDLLFDEVMAYTYQVGLEKLREVLEKLNTLRSRDAAEYLLSILKPTYVTFNTFFLDAYRKNYEAYSNLSVQFAPWKKSNYQYVQHQCMEFYAKNPHSTKQIERPASILGRICTHTMEYKTPATTSLYDLHATVQHVHETSSIKKYNTVLLAFPVTSYASVHNLTSVRFINSLANIQKLRTYLQDNLPDTKVILVSVPSNLATQNAYNSYKITPCLDKDHQAFWNKQTFYMTLYNAKAIVRCESYHLEKDIMSPEEIDNLYLRVSLFRNPSNVYQGVAKNMVEKIKG